MVGRFDWKFYIDYYPDLRRRGLTTRVHALWHYKNYGRAEGRICNMESLYLKYQSEQRRKKRELNKAYVSEAALDKSQSTPSVMFNVLVRCSYRPTYFHRCIGSVINQTYKHARVIICYDDDRCLEYLNSCRNHPQISFFKAPTVDRSYPHFYNLYCNALLSHVKSGWIMFLDDDDFLVKDNALAMIEKEINDDDDIIFWKAKLGPSLLDPPDIQNINVNEIGSFSFCFHSSHKNLARWKQTRAADYKFLAKLLSSHTSFNRKKIESVLTGTQHNHHGQYGIVDGQGLETVFGTLKVEQAHVSSSLSHLEGRFFQKFNLRPITDPLKPAVFFGIYSPADVRAIMLHRRAPVVICGGSDVPNTKHLKPKKTIRYLAISRDIQDRLMKLNTHSIQVRLNLVDESLFSFIPRSQRGNKVFIYDGFRKKPDNARIYNQPLIDKVKQRLPYVEFIHSSDLGLPYERMPSIYRQCSIGLRLTMHDGNANMVQEMEAMGIPVVHNQSDYGLKWESAEDVVRYIKENTTIRDPPPDLLTCSGKKILINTHSNLNVTAGDTIMVSNLVNTLTAHDNDVVVVATHSDGQFRRNLVHKDRCHSVPVGTSSSEVVDALDKHSEDADLVFVRNHNILPDMRTKSYLYKTVFYGLDVHAKGLGGMNNQFHQVITQSEQLKATLVSSGVAESKVTILEPIAYKYSFKLPERNDNEVRLIYCGTLRDEENILEIIEEFQKIHKERPEVVLKIVYGKIHGDGIFTRNINEHIENGVEGITFKHNLSHREACYEIATSDVGICWRKNGWGDNGEVSTKVKEYKRYGLEICDNYSYLNSISRNNIAVILDEFSYNSLTNTNSLNIYQVCSNNVFDIFNNYYIRLFFCESAWRGLNEMWKGKIYNSINFKHDNTKELRQILDYCKKHKKKTMFWNKEDPAHYYDRIHDFVKTSLDFDIIYTTSTNCISKYKKDYNKDVKLLDFFVNLEMFNPIKKNNKVSNANAITFYGSWYSYFPNRCECMITIFDNIIKHDSLDLVIYDRFYSTDDKNHVYPEKYKKYIKPSIENAEICDSMKNSKYSLTMNSVQDDLTMFARRVHEINVSNVLTLSNYSKGIANIFNDTIYFIEDENDCKKFNDLIEMKNNNKYDLLKLINLNKSLSYSLGNVLLDKILNSTSPIKMKSFILLNKNPGFKIVDSTIVNNISQIGFNTDYDYAFLGKFPQSKNLLKKYIAHYEYIQRDIVLCIQDNNELNYTFEKGHKINMNNMYIFPCNKQIDLENINIYYLPNINLLNIIIPCYNSENKYNNCIESLKGIKLDTSFYNILFIDDYSNDNTAKHLMNIGNENKIIIVLDSNSGSPSKPRNIGMHLSNSKIISFLDIDDEYIPDMINENMVIGSILNYNLVRFPLLKRTYKNQSIDNLPLVNTIKNKSSTMIINDLIKYQSTTAPGFYNLSFLKQNNILFNINIKSSEDTLFLMEIYNKTKPSKVKYYDSPIFIYNSFVQDEQNLSTTQNYGDKAINDHLFVINNMKSINEKWLQLRVDVFIKCMMENLIFITNTISEDTYCSLKRTFSNYFKNYKFNLIKRYLDIINIIINGKYCEFLEIIKPRVLVSGFDFKFINELLDGIKSDYNLKLDKWDGHTKKKWKVNNNGNKILKENLDWADIILCEWMLGNAVFYSNNKRHYQKLFIRCHRFELTRNDFKHINIKNVNKIICVSQYYKRLTHEITNFELNKLIYIPNYIDTKKYEYSYDYYYTIAIVGILPTRKNLFKALQILKTVNKAFPQIQFNIYGRTYKECSWLINDKETIEYFDKCDNYVKTNNLTVNYKGFQDMKIELKKNDFVLSLSEKEKIFESFHIGAAEGFVCGCISLFSYWYGVDEIYPNEYIFTEITKISDFIIDFYKNNKDKSQINKKGRDHVIKNYDIDIVKNKFKTLFSR